MKCNWTSPKQLVSRVDLLVMWLGVGVKMPLVKFDVEPQERNKFWYHKKMSDDSKELTMTCKCGYTEKGFAFPYVKYQLLECPKCKMHGVAYLPPEDRNPPLTDNVIPERAMFL